jgi:cell division transport system permease protein
MSRALYFVRQALIDLQRNLFVSGVTIITVGVVFLVLGVFAVIGYNLYFLAEQLSAELQMSVYLRDDLNAEQRSALEALLSTSTGVASVRLKSRAEALEDFRNRLGPDMTILDSLSDNPVPASLEVTFASGGKNPAIMHNLAQQLSDMPGVEEVQYSQGWVERFFGFLEIGRTVGLVIVALIVLSTLLIVSNTIRLAVYARQEEIQILILVGATNRFVKAPFCIEGVVLCTIGALLGTGLSWLLYWLVVPEVLVPSGFGGSGMTIIFLPSIGVAGMVIGGALLGLLGTVASLGKHLNL